MSGPFKVTAKSKNHTEAAKRLEVIINSQPLRDELLEKVHREVSNFSQEVIDNLIWGVQYPEAWSDNEDPGE